MPDKYDGLVEPPCEATGGPCTWVSEDWEDHDGTPNWDLYCCECYRSRDWGTDEMVPNQESIAPLARIEKLVPSK